MDPLGVLLAVASTTALFCYIHTVKDTPESTMPMVPKVEIICGPSDR